MDDARRITMLFGRCLLAVPFLLAGATLGAQGRTSAKGDLPAVDRTGFTRIFDGKTLEGWDGDPTYWSAREGILMGRVTPETLLKKNSWIVWRGARVQDFELVLDYRVSAEGNSGIGYRLAVLEDDPFSVRGPQADIEGRDRYTAICYEENGRRLLAARGQATWVDPGELPRLMGQFGDPETLQGVVRKEDWNRYRLVVRGHDARHYLNGVLMSEVHDHDDANRITVGLLGVQVHVGPPMTIEYRDIFLKHLGTPPVGPTDRKSLVYRPGTMREPDHRATFENLTGQEARLTAPAPEAPIDGQTELEVVTRTLGTVRHDLVDVPLSGGSKPYATPEERFDLVVMDGDRTIRVPDAGDWLTGKPLDRDYRIRLRWDPGKKAYTVVELEPANGS